jgi:Na+/proline symporter
MELIDWIVLVGTIVLITLVGMWKSRGSRNTEDYLLSRKMSWSTIGLSIMATQASAITFLSTPGQAYSDGMRFVQFYLGLPLAMIVLSITAVPIFHRLKVYTAYEYLEGRFDLKTRALGALLFLTQRGLAAGLTIYAPSLVLSTILGWDISIVNIAIGGLVIIYTVSGGTTAVSITQKQQMFVIFLGMLIAGIMVVQRLPEQVSFGQAVQIAGKMDKLNTINFNFDWRDRYNIWSGLIGGFFLSLSYFGTDQSQVQRYLGGRSVAESRLGLLFNGFIKIPMQFLILFIGAMVFVFYQFEQAPVYFNRVEVNNVLSSADSSAFRQIEASYVEAGTQKREQAFKLAQALETGDEAKVATQSEALKQAEAQSQLFRKEAVELIGQHNGGSKGDTNYVFLTFVITYLPKGIIGLLIAVIISASMSSTSSELNALASTTVIDVYKRSIKPRQSEAHYLQASKVITVLWGIYAILLAEFANSLSNNLIEAVNILGSLFYGTILGIFLVAFYIKKVGGHAVFIAAILAEALVIAFWYLDITSYLWFNVIGCVLVILLSLIFQHVLPSTRQR